MGGAFPTKLPETGDAARQRFRSIGPGARGCRVGASGEGGEKLCRRKAKVAAPKHGGREAVHDRLRLHMEIAKHFVGSPAANHAQPVAVDAGAKKRHGAASASGADGHVDEGVRGVGVEVENRANASSDIGGRDVPEWGRRRAPDRVEGGVSGGALRP